MLRSIRFGSLAITALLITGITACSTKKAMNDMYAVMEVKEPIPGVCNQNKVLVLMPFASTNQVEAKAPISLEEIAAELTKYVAPTDLYAEEAISSTMEVIINCKGKVVDVDVNDSEIPPGLARQIETYFNSMPKWTPGTHSGKPFDTVRFITIRIENGVLTLS